jgi:hypothetical protein
LLTNVAPFDVPTRLAPASIIAFICSNVLTPPEALIIILLPTCVLNNLTSSIVAPPVEKPVDVLMKLALPSITHLQALILSC